MLGIDYLDQLTIILIPLVFVLQDISLVSNIVVLARN